MVGRFEPRGLAGAFPDKAVPASKIKFGVGDVVSVTIFEAAAGGLFIPTEAGVRPGNFVTIPDQVVDNDGNISVPYAGLVKAAGRDNGEIQTDIVNRIKNRAIEPQAVVALTQQRTSLVSVIGEVNAPVRYPAAAYGAQDRITDAITRAGGIKGQGFETLGDVASWQSSRHRSVCESRLRTVEQHLCAARRPHLRLPRAAEIPRIRRDRPAG